MRRCALVVTTPSAFSPLLSSPRHSFRTSLDVIIAALPSNRAGTGAAPRQTVLVDCVDADEPETNVQVHQEFMVVPGDSLVAALGAVLSHAAKTPAHKVRMIMGRGVCML